LSSIDIPVLKNAISQLRKMFEKSKSGVLMEQALKMNILDMLIPLLVHDEMQV
jgi:hypothetical protein